jgi:hypothetical protein
MDAPRRLDARAGACGGANRQPRLRPALEASGLRCDQREIDRIRGACDRGQGPGGRRGYRTDRERMEPGLQPARPLLALCGLRLRHTQPAVVPGAGPILQVNRDRERRRAGR